MRHQFFVEAKLLPVASVGQPVAVNAPECIRLCFRPLVLSVEERLVHVKCDFLSFMGPCVKFTPWARKLFSSSLSIKAFKVPLEN